MLGRALLRRLLSEDRTCTANCLVQQGLIAVASEWLYSLFTDEPSIAGRVNLVVGDITRPDLGLGDHLQEIARATTEIFHLAAIYDLAVDRADAVKVNIDGTKHVCDLAFKCRSLNRLHYVSTCYVSGRHNGTFLETELAAPDARFNNFYEETKHIAESYVRDQMNVGLPATIYRPSVIAGNSRTGDTQKLDGIYYVIRWVLRQPKWAAIVPVIGNTSTTTFNVIPLDVAAEAISMLSARSDTLGHCYALADPSPMSIRTLLELVEDASDRRLIKIPLPLRLVRSAIKYVPGLSRLTGIPPEALNYFVHPTRYDTSNTIRAIGSSGLFDWDRKEWIAALVEFTAKNMDMTSEPMLSSDRMDIDAKQ